MIKMKGDNNTIINMLHMKGDIVTITIHLSERLAPHDSQQRVGREDGEVREVEENNEGLGEEIRSLEISLVPDKHSRGAPRVDIKRSDV
jgi:hypothetical protein